jgi:hypothetical protein
MSKRNAIRQLKYSGARFFRESFRNLIPRRQRLLQGNMRLDGLLDLVQSKTEFTPRAG